MIDFSAVKNIAIPEGKVSQVKKSDGTVLWTAGLPSIYQQVEYIRADSKVKAYIDLGFCFDSACKIETEIYHERVSGTRSYLFGAAQDASSMRFMLIGEIDGIYIATMNTGNVNTTISVAGNTSTTYNKIVIEASGTQATIHNKTTNVSKSGTLKPDMAMTANLYLLAQNYNGSPRYDVGNYRQIGYFKYWDKNNTLICDLVPCYRKSDGVVGMYDLVRRQFLTNSGTGSFVAGGKV